MMQNSTEIHERGESIDVVNDVKPKITLDTILTNEIGQFGSFQRRALVLAGIISICATWGGLEYIFTTARISTRCMIPECDSPQPEWSPDWLPNAVPATSLTTFDNCQRYGNVSTVLRQVESELCPSALFDRSTLQSCDEYIYENSYSVAYDFQLACDEWSRGLIGTVRILGSLIALPIIGYVSDRWGRRMALILSSFNTCWMGVLRYWSNTYIGFMLSEFFEATFGSGGYSTNYILLLEILGPKHRAAGGAAIHTFGSIGQMLMGLIAWAVPNWRYLTLTLYIPQLISISYFWLVSESVRWYMSKGRFDDSESVLKKIAKINGTQVSDKSLQALRDTVLEEAKIKALNDERKSQEPWLIVQVFKHKRILLRCIVSPVWWVTNTFIYYGLSINSVNMSGNRYLNYVATAAVDIPGFWTAFFLMSRIGRKPVLIGAYWICAACQIAYIFISSEILGKKRVVVFPKWFRRMETFICAQDLQTVSLIVYLIAKYSIAMVSTSIYIYTTELYPTTHRHSLFAFSSMIGRIGNIVAPLTPAFGAQWFEELPFVLFACFALVSGVLIFLTPETHNTKLPDTFEEASQIGSKNINK